MKIFVVGNIDFNGQDFIQVLFVALYVSIADYQSFEVYM